MILSLQTLSVLWFNQEKRHPRQRWGRLTPEPSETSRWAGRWKFGSASSATRPLSPEPTAAVDDDSAAMSPCPAGPCWPTLASSSMTARRKHPGLGGRRGAGSLGGSRRILRRCHTVWREIHPSCMRGSPTICALDVDAVCTEESTPRGMYVCVRVNVFSHISEIRPSLRCHKGRAISGSGHMINANGSANEGRAWDGCGGRSAVGLSQGSPVRGRNKPWKEPFHPASLVTRRLK